MRIKVGLSQKVDDLVPARVVFDERERHDERHTAAPVVDNRLAQLSSRRLIEVLAEVARQVFQHVGVAARRGDGFIASMNACTYR